MNVNFNPFPSLKGKRLSLKKMTANHVRGLYKYQSNKENFPYVDMPVFTDLAEAHHYIEKLNKGVSENKWIIWAICLAKSDEIIGTISIWNINCESEKAELGYGIFPEYRQQGYMQEALSLVIHYGFDILKLQAIEAYTSPVNEPSINLLKKMNFQFAKTFKDEYASGAWMDMFVIHDNRAVLQDSEQLSDKD